MLVSKKSFKYDNAFKNKIQNKKKQKWLFCFYSESFSFRITFDLHFFLTLCDFIGRMDYHSMFCFYIHLTIPFIQNFKKILVYTCICFWSLQNVRSIYSEVTPENAHHTWRTIYRQSIFKSSSDSSSSTSWSQNEVVGICV